MSSPLPASLPFVALLLPAVLLGGIGLGRRVTVDRALSGSLAPPLALALWLLSMHAVGLAFHSFVDGLVLGTSAAAGVGLALWRTAPLAAGPAIDRRTLAVRGAVVLLVTLPVARLATGWAFHDEDLITGHLSIPSEIGNGIYPPRHLTFAQVELGYHYGFDLLTACLATLFRLRVDKAIDLATVTLWAMSAWLVAALADLWIRPGRGPIAIVTTLLAGGFPICLTAQAHAAPSALGLCPVRGIAIVSSVVSNFFQHPWALGIPLGLAALICTSLEGAGRESERYRARLGALTLLWVALSIGHVVLLVTLLPTLMATELWTAWRRRRPLRDWLALAASATVAILLAWVLGGFFRAPAWGAAMPFDFRLGAAGDFETTLLWHLQSFGLLPVAALVGLARVRRDAQAKIVLLVVGCLVVLNTAHYRYSGDVVKFGVVATLALGLAAAAGVDRVLDLAGRSAGGILWRRAAGAVAATLLVLAACAGGAGFTLVFLLTPGAASEVFKGTVPPLAGDDALAAEFLRRRVKAGEVTYRRRHAATAYALWAGLPIVWADWAVSSFGFPASWMRARQHLLTHLPATPDAYRAEGITWFVLGPEDVALAPSVEGWTRAGEAALMASFGALRIFRLSSATRFTSAPIAS